MKAEFVAVVLDFVAVVLDVTIKARNPRIRVWFDRDGSPPRFIVNCYVCLARAAFQDDQSAFASAQQFAHALQVWVTNFAGQHAHLDHDPEYYLELAAR